MASNDVLDFISGLLQSIADFLWTEPIKYVMCAILLTLIVRVVLMLMGKEV